MIRYKYVIALTLVGLCFVPLATAVAQLGGSRAGVAATSSSPSGHSRVPLLTVLEPEAAEGYITVDGQVELRLPPTKIRIVLAVTAEATGPAECKRLVQQKVSLLAAAWEEMGVPIDDIVEDFVAVLPRYDFVVEKVRDRDMAVEKRVGFTMQSNLHVAADGDVQAMEILDVAFAHDIADIIAFDYWNDELDRAKVEAREQAVNAAREKADVLFGALFDPRPPLINVQESTNVIYPQSLYESFTNVNAAHYQPSYSRGSMPEVRTYRPKNTYYRGLYPDADVQPRSLPMRAELSVVSTVRLYYQSPSTRPKALPKPGSRK